MCKSDRIQEIDLNVTIEKGWLWWEIFVPHTSLYLSVGVKDTAKSKFASFDFSLKDSAHLQFKVNLESGAFKTWINGIESIAKPEINLEK